MTRGQRSALSDAPSSPAYEPLSCRESVASGGARGHVAYLHTCTAPPRSLSMNVQYSVVCESVPAPRSACNTMRQVPAESQVAAYTHAKYNEIYVSTPFLAYI